MQTRSRLPWRGPRGLLTGSFFFPFSFLEWLRFFSPKSKINYYVNDVRNPPDRAILLPQAGVCLTLPTAAPYNSEQLLVQ